ncbi:MULTISPECIES: hypothetical protein [unclassified Butyrivibrio]|uniref:hypothetical protein n=1 Tax=unclassified Butyrivibrio TaxID=2639466 RepID=UPI0003B4E7B5|nr:MULTISPECIES: hypothetical protein [unclassified Butyrivibrio]MDC7295253.1 hypothetical protein [Butyrivibrio sp. DSM 10294]
MSSKVYKGEFGYIKYRRKVAIIRTAICLIAAIGMYVTGLLLFKTQKNGMSIIAALGCLPTGWSGVNLIMLLKAAYCSDADHEKIEACKGDLLIHYDHVITSYDTNYNIAASTVLDKNICLYASDDKLDIHDCEKHIKKMIAQSGYSSYSIKIFKDIDQFCSRLSQLEKLRSEKNIDPKAIEDAWVPGTVETAASVLLSISL